VIPTQRPAPNDVTPRRKTPVKCKYQLFLVATGSVAYVASEKQNFPACACLGVYSLRLFYNGWEGLTTCESSRCYNYQASCGDALAFLLRCRYCGASTERSNVYLTMLSVAEVIGWMTLTGKRGSTPTKACPIAALSSTNPTGNGLRWSPDLRGDWVEM